MDADEVTRAVGQHIRGQWPERLTPYRWELGDFQRDHPRWRTYVAGPRDGQEYWAYVSAGAWQATSRDGHAHEFVLHSPVEENLHIEKMAALTRRQADRAVEPLTARRAIALGEPWLEGSPMDHAYFGSPVSYPEEFEFLEVEGLVIHFLWMVPIHEDEARFIEHEGGEAFEDRLEETRVNLTDPRRPSVA